MNLTYEQIETIAKACHEANKAYCHTIGDDTQLHWDAAPEWQKVSARKGVAHAMDPEAKPSDSHGSWLAEKEAEGWQYGPVKDTTNKLHPCFVPFEKLPPEQKRKDYIFLAVARAMASALDTEV